MEYGTGLAIAEPGPGCHHWEQRAGVHGCSSSPFTSSGNCCLSDKVRYELRVAAHMEVDIVQ